jgi:hypothetical protein
MTKNVWTVLDGATDISSKVLSMSINQGREKYLDTYSGGQCLITINNSGDYASTIEYGSVIHVYGGTDIARTDEFRCDFWVQRIDYQDHPGNTGLNTATITAVDWIARAGRINADNIVLSESNVGGQMAQFLNSSGGPLPADMAIVMGGNSTCSASTYSGTVNNYLNYLAQTERVYFTTYDNNLASGSRSTTGGVVITDPTIGPTSSYTQIAYQSFERIQNGLQFINTASISPAGLATQTGVNSTSVSTYGGAYFSASTVDSTTTQALGNANWVANTFSDPASLRFKCSFIDRAQNSNALRRFGGYFVSLQKQVNFLYTVPGGSSTTVYCVIEGWSIDITPEQTRWSLSLSPMTYYQFFTLNSTTLGILDTSRLGW